MCGCARSVLQGNVNLTTENKGNVSEHLKWEKKSHLMVRVFGALQFDLKIFSIILYNNTHDRDHSAQISVFQSVYEVLMSTKIVGQKKTRSKHFQ